MGNCGPDCCALLDGDCEDPEMTEIMEQDSVIGDYDRAMKNIFVTTLDFFTKQAIMTRINRFTNLGN